METTIFYNLVSILAIFVLFIWMPFYSAKKSVQKHPRAGKKIKFTYVLLILVGSCFLLIFCFHQIYPSLEGVSFEGFLNLVKNNWTPLAISAFFASSLMYAYTTKLTNMEEMRALKDEHTLPNFPNDLSSIMFWVSVILLVSGIVIGYNFF